MVMARMEPGPERDTSILKWAFSPGVTRKSLPDEVGKKISKKADAEMG